MVPGEDAAAAAHGAAGTRDGHAAGAADATVVQMTPLQYFLFPLSLFRFVEVEIVFNLQDFSSHSRRHVHLL